MKNPHLNLKALPKSYLVLILTVEENEGCLEWTPWPASDVADLPDGWQGGFDSPGQAVGHALRQREKALASGRPRILLWPIDPSTKRPKWTDVRMYADLVIEVGASEQSPARVTKIRSMSEDDATALLLSS